MRRLPYFNAMRPLGRFVSSSTLFLVFLAFLHLVQAIRPRAMQSYSDYVKEKKERVKAIFQRHEASPIADRSSVSDVIEYNCQRAWQVWNAYVREPQRFGVDF